MSKKTNLKDKIKKPNATQTFFNSYDTPENDNNNDNDNKIDNNIENANKNNNNKDNDNKKENINIDNNKTYVNNDNVVNSIDNNDIDNENDDDYLRGLALGRKAPKKKAKKIFTSFYMDPDLASEVDKIAARGSKGDKSKLINTAIRKLLEEYEVIEKR